ncbi:MAG: zinc ribbon domain-containing protein [Pirellulaceae bacterium]
MSPQIDPRHHDTRAILRIVGPALVVVGLLFVLVGFGSFFAALGSFEPPRYFWCAFVGLPLIAVGGAICKFAFLGAVTRYMANEVAPVGKDVVNYMAEGTQDAVRHVASAIGQGLHGGSSGPQAPMVPCGQCRAENDATANFCNQCGAPLAPSQACPACGARNDKDSRFCIQCGKPVA